MIHLRSALSRNTSKWTCMVVLYICCTVASLNVPSPPYTTITVDETDDNSLSEVSRRGYAGEDFYTKASKSIPRMGRRANLDPLSCKLCGTSSSAEETNEVTNDLTGEDSNEILKFKLKRHNLQTPSELSTWPWFRDRIPDVSKRNELTDNCYYMQKIKNYVSNNEICYDDLICCPITTDASVLKRFLSTYSPKQTTTISPDYKANRYM